MPRIAASVLAVIVTLALTDLALAGASPAVVAALAALALVSVLATAALGRTRRVAAQAYQRGYHHASSKP